MSNINYPYSIPIIDIIRNNYESFRFETHELSHKGLYTDGKKIYAVISEASGDEAKKSTLNNLYEQFRTLAIPPVVIVGETHANFAKIPLRSSFEKSHLFGQTFTRHEFVNLLNIHIPKKYQPFYADMTWGTNEFQIILKNKISDDEKEEIQLICEALGYQGFNYVFEINPEISDYPGRVNLIDNSRDSLQLVASSFIQKQFSKNILEKYEEDEDFWVQNRRLVFNGDDVGNQPNFLPNTFLGKHTKCFIDASIFQRRNLRVYLSLYEKIIIALPFKSDKQTFYDMFDITSTELKELIYRGRLLFVVPQNLARYSEGLLQEIIETNYNSIIFSRQLTAATIQGIQHKTGLAGFTFSSDAQYEFLNSCAKSQNDSLKLLAKSLSEQWQCTEYMIDKEGAVSVFRAGLSNLVNKVFESTGKDFYLELTTASASFEFAQGLNAHHFPFDSDQYSEVAACEIISKFYSGVTSNPQFIKESEISMLLERVLAIKNDMNILELDDALTSNNLRAIPNILKEYSNLNSTELNLKLYQLRKELLQIEKNKKNFATLDITGTLAPSIVGAAMEYSNQPGGAYLSLAGWLFKALCHLGNQPKLVDNPIFTRLASVGHRVSQDTIIIKNYRDAIQKYSSIS